MDAKTDRDKRLAEALRTNLRRRKEQAREKDADVSPHESQGEGGGSPEATAAD